LRKGESEGDFGRAGRTSPTARPRASPPAPKARRIRARGASPGNRAPHNTPSPEGAEDGAGQSEASNDEKTSSTSRTSSASGSRPAPSARLRWFPKWFSI